MWHISPYVYMSYYGGAVNLILREKFRLTRRKYRNFDILIIGECYSLTGVIPQIIEKTTGFTCYNFSTHTPHTILSSYCLFKDYIESHKTKPKYVILAFASRAYNIKITDPSYLYEAAQDNFKIYIEEFGILKATRFSLPFLRHELFFRQVIKDPGVILKLKIRKKEFIHSYIKSCEIDKGYSYWHAEQIYRDNATDSGYKKEYDFYPSSFSLKYLHKTMELAEQNNMKIVYLITTSPPDWYGLFNKYRHIEKRDKFIEGLKEKYRNITVLNPQDMLNEKQFYSSGHHLNKNGAILLSKFLAQEINKLKT